MDDARTRKIRAGSEVMAQRTIYIYITDKFHSKVVYVELTQACPNYCCALQYKRSDMSTRMTW